MKILFLFFIIIKISFSMFIESLSWGMTESEVKNIYTNIQISSFDDNEKIFIADTIINSDTVSFTFLFYKDRLIQVTVSNKYPRQSRSFSKNFLEKVGQNYTFSDINTKYEKSNGHIRQIKEYIGSSIDGDSHLLLKVDLDDNNHKNTFIFSDNNFIKNNF